jgi:hypothetical protein
LAIGHLLSPKPEPLLLLNPFSAASDVVGDLGSETAQTFTKMSNPVSSGLCQGPKNIDLYPFIGILEMEKVIESQSKRLQEGVQANST